MKNKAEIKVSRAMSDRVYTKITCCQFIGWTCFISGIIGLLIGWFNNDITATMSSCGLLGGALTFSLLVGHFKALYPMTKNAENQIAIDGEKYNFVRNEDIDITE